MRRRAGLLERLARLHQLGPFHAIGGQNGDRSSVESSLHFDLALSTEREWSRSVPTLTTTTRPRRRIGLSFFGCLSSRFTDTRRSADVLTTPCAETSFPARCCCM